MSDINDLRIAFNNIGIEKGWDAKEFVGICGTFTVTNPAYMSKSAMDNLGMSYVSTEYPIIYSKFYPNANEYKFEYQTSDFAR